MDLLLNPVFYTQVCMLLNENLCAASLNTTEHTSTCTLLWYFQRLRNLVLHMYAYVYERVCVCVCVCGLFKGIELHSAYVFKHSRIPVSNNCFKCWFVLSLKHI